MQPIADMEDDKFMKLQELYGPDLPICGVCTLEDARLVLSWIFSKRRKARRLKTCVRCWRSCYSW
jgi:hypothetical protein